MIKWHLCSFCILPLRNKTHKYWYQTCFFPTMNRPSPSCFHVAFHFLDFNFISKCKWPASNVESVSMMHTLQGLIMYFKQYGHNIQLMIHSTLVQYTTQHFGSCNYGIRLEFPALCLVQWWSLIWLNRCKVRGDICIKGFAMIGNFMPMPHIA